MAQFQLTLKYQKPSQKLAFIISCILLPVWSIIIPVLLGIFIRLFFSGNLGFISPIAFWIIFATFMSFIFMGVFLTALAEDDRIYITNEGISFPLNYLARLKFKRTKFWQELNEIDFFKNNNDNIILLNFKNTGLIDIHSNHFNQKDLDEFMLSLEMYGKNIKTTDNFITFKDSLHVSDNNSLTFTKMWEDELTRRFSNTAFIPLEPKSKLKDGKLEIVRQIAFGGFSAIYLAQFNNLDLVVLKEIVIPQNADATAKEKALLNFKKEASILSKLDHPNIVKVKDFFVEDNRQYLMMDYESGQDLRQLVAQNGLMNENEASQIMLKVAGAIDYLHSQSPPIIHRDISPDNIILKNNGEILIIDFGAANEFMGTATGTLIGKQAYMAPEQLQGRATLASDVYGFGATFYFLITGRDPIPLSASNIKDVLPGSSQELTDFIIKCTQFELESRFNNISQIILDLNSINEKLLNVKG